MRLEFGGRQTGKTYQMLQWLGESTAERPRALVVHSEIEKRRIDELLDSGGRPQGAVVMSAASRSYPYDGREVAIDNVDIILRQMFGNVTRASFTIPGIHPPELPVPTLTIFDIGDVR